ncbi:MAG: phosphate ABC transporter permease PstA [Leptolyngbyaceae cyanobacterium SL_5_9]|nr:phosphate ABC transporter permease PstA [Leptolyngbyaceae cyanobacterium SL_5_9]NJO74546.1 phosphate ABC transporter permease PstA [Leptolyngbyaceae cyanobacterium RM1_406_9]
MANSSDAAIADSQLGSGAYSVSSKRRIFGKVMTVLAGACAAIALIPLASIIFTLVVNGFSRFNLEVFTELPPPPLSDGGGFRNALIGTLITVFIGSLICVPFGVLAAVYQSEFGRGSKLASVIRFCTNVLSGVPSIIAGLFAYGLVVLVTGTFSAVAGGVALSVLMLPIVVRTAEEGLKSIPMDVRRAAVGVGATNFQVVWKIVLPAALPFIATGVTLAVARAAGETAPLLFTALFNQYGITGLEDIWQPIATLSVMIYTYSISPYQNQQELAWVAALVVVLLILTVSIISRYIARRRVY